MGLGGGSSGGFRSHQMCFFAGRLFHGSYCTKTLAKSLIGGLRRGVIQCKQERKMLRPPTH